ncbi:MAG: anaerobic ribonucleoside-triphosphate reductase activating protein [Clostridia bacterium]|nr:anaerobic ribonucleoside-triphosphate reductase activating protein [Clostridia bacterium]
MKIKGLQKLTLLDYPGKLAATVFLGGCNFRCPFCHNGSLVLGDGGEDISEDELYTFLNSRRGKLSGVCITGGEPTLYRELPSLIKNIKDMGYLVKLDTNGTNPDMLIDLVTSGLVDYVAMDIKNSKESYPLTAGVGGLDISPIEASVEFLMSGVVDYEFRTTVVRELHTHEDMVKIGKWIEGARAYFLQSYRDSEDVILPSLSAHDTKTVAEFLDAVKVYVPNAQIRG